MWLAESHCRTFGLLLAGARCQAAVRRCAVSLLDCENGLLVHREGTYVSFFSFFKTLFAKVGPTMGKLAVCVSHIASGSTSGYAAPVCSLGKLLGGNRMCPGK